MVQLVPPAAVTALGAQWEWGLVCGGTAHGLALVDALNTTALLHKCTLNPHGTSTLPEGPWASGIARQSPTTVGTGLWIALRPNRTKPESTRASFSTIDGGR